MHRVDAKRKKPLGGAPQQGRLRTRMAFVSGRLAQASIAALAVWTLSCGGGGSEPVTQAVASVTVSPSAVSMGVGDTRQLTAMLLDASGTPLSARPVSWTTSNIAIATV